MQSFFSERDAVQAPRALTNRPSTELPSTLLGQSPCTVLKGSVIAESDQDLAQLLARRRPYKTGKTAHGTALRTRRGAGPPVTFVSEPCASEPLRTHDLTPGGNMMEMEHVPKARLLVRHPMRRSPTAPTLEAAPLMRGTTLAPTTFGRAASAPTHPMTFDAGSAVPPYPSQPLYPTLPQGIQAPGLDSHHPEVPTLMPETPSLQLRKAFDVTRLGSLRYQQIGAPMQQTAQFFQTEPCGVPPLQRMPAYSPPPISHFLCDPPPPVHPGLQPQQVALYREGPEARGAVPSSMYNMMIPTPRFVAGSGGEIHRCGGPIEPPEMKRNGRKQYLIPHEVLFGEEEGSALEFMDQLLGLDKPATPAKPKKAPKKSAMGRGVTKAKAAAKKTPAGRKGQPKGNKAQNLRTKPAKIQGNKGHLASQIVAPPPEDGMADPSCLFYMPHLTESYWPPPHGEVPYGESLRSSDRDDLSDVFRIFEDAGLEFRPNENTLLPASCPLLPLGETMAPPCLEGAIEVAFTLLGSSIATVEELQSVMQARLPLSARGPWQNPGLELWPGWDATKIFSDDLKGQTEIITCLEKGTDLFRYVGKDRQNQDLWECIGLVTPEKERKASKKQGKSKVGQVKRKRKGTGELTPEVKSFKMGPEATALFDNDI